MRSLFVALIVALAGCALQTGSAVVTNPSTPRHLASTNHIQHVVVIVQENRTFDNLLNGFPGADTAQTGLDHNGNVRTLVPVQMYGHGDWSNAASNCKVAYDGGKMDGFDLDKVIGKTAPPSNYSFVQPSDNATYWAMALQYAVGDRMFESNCGPSFPAHQYIIAGQTGAEFSPYHKPWGCDGQPVLCFDYQTLADLLDTAALPWTFYANGTDIYTPSMYSPYLAYDAIRHIRYGSDWTTAHIGIPETTIFADIQAGNLASVAWVTPYSKNSDHHPDNKPGSTSGEAWVASVVDAIGQSQYWNTTAIFIVWDDWGGWYDHVPPTWNYSDGLGLRVPLIVISPYARHGYVSHVQHEFGSIIHFTEETFGLANLGQRDVTSDDLMDMFDFTQQPSGFHPFVHRDFEHGTGGPANDD